MSRRNLEIISISNSETLPFIAPGYCLATCYIRPQTFAAVTFKMAETERDPHTLIPELLEQFIHLMTLDDQRARGIFDIHPDAPLFITDVRVLQIIEGTPRAF